MTQSLAISIISSSGSNVDPSVHSPEECFSLFFSDALWQFLVDNTNKYAAKKIGCSNKQLVTLTYLLLIDKAWLIVLKLASSDNR